MGSLGRGSWLCSAFVALILCLGGCPLWAQGGDPYEGLIVREIRFVGLERQSADAVRALLATEVGKPYRSEVLNRDVKRLGGSVDPGAAPTRQDPNQPPAAPDRRAEIGALFGNIETGVERSTDGQGVVITFFVIENRRVANIVFIGALEFDREELLGQIATRPGSYADPATIEFDRIQILRNYREQGFAFASVEAAIDKSDEGDLVVFRITEGAEVEIRSVTFEGAKSFLREELLEVMPGTDEPGWFSSKNFVQDEVTKDRASLLRFYRGKGFLDAEVRLDPPMPTPDFREVDLRFVVTEGEPFVVRSFTIMGLTLLDEAQLRTEFRTQIGDRYEPGFDLLRDLQLIEERLQELGHTQARVADESVVDLEGAGVDVLLRVTEGNLTRVGAITIEGNLQTKDNVIRREIELFTGDPLNMTQLRRAGARIRSLQYWQQGDPRGGVESQDVAPSRSSLETFKSAYVTFREVGEDDIRDVEVRVREGETGRLRFAAGIGSNTGLIGDITYTKTNFDPFDFPEDFDEIGEAFTGAGQTLILSLQPGPEVTRWRVFWANPRVFDSPYGVSAELSQILWLREDWRENRIGYGLGITRRFTEDLRVTLNLRDEVVDVTDIGRGAPQLVFDFEGENRLVSLGLDAALNRLDDFINPTSGYELRASFEHAGLWGDIEYNRIRFDGDKYWLMDVDEEDRPHVLRLRGTLGWASEFGGSRDIPVYERFFAGGANSLRGFAFRQVGPKDSGDPIGGKAIWLASTEYHFPLFGENLRGVAFADSGSVGLDWSDEVTFRPRLTVGFGIRLVIPFLSATAPLAIDFGFPISKEDGDRTEFISFSLGTR